MAERKGRRISGRGGTAHFDTKQWEEWREGRERVMDRDCKYKYTCE